MRWKKRKKELDEKYEYFWNHISINGIETEEEKGMKKELRLIKKIVKRIKRMNAEECSNFVEKLKSMKWKDQ